jgi:hypothetical protein
MYFIPFSLFPFTMAKVLYWLFLVTLICSGLILSYHLINPDFGKSGDQKRFNNLVLLTALITGVHVARELELGQMNQLLYVLYITMIVFYQKKKDVFLSLFWAISIFIKSFGLIFLPWLILKKKYRVIGYFILLIILLALMPVMFTGVDQLQDQYAQWFNELHIELSAKQSVLADGNHTIFSLLSRFTPISFTSIPQAHTAVFQLSVFALLSGMMIWIWQRGKDIVRSEVLEAAVLITLIPLLAFTSYNAFGFAELAVCIVLYYFRHLPMMIKLITIFGLIMLGGNIYELVGRDLWKVIDNLSAVGFGAALLITVMVIIRKQRLA